MALKVNCSECGGQFTTDDMSLNTRMLDGGIVETFFTCPHCKTDYPIMKTNQQIRALQGKQAELEKRVKLTNRQMTSQELKEWTLRQRKIKGLLDVLNNKVVVK